MKSSEDDAVNDEGEAEDEARTDGGRPNTSHMTTTQPIASSIGINVQHRRPSRFRIVDFLVVRRRDTQHTKKSRSDSNAFNHYTVR